MSNLHTEVENIGGMKVHLRPNTSDRVVAVDNLASKGYEKHFDIQSGECWLDLGGYIGTFALRCLQAGASVLSIEPLPEHVRLYKKNLFSNGYKDRCNIKQAVVLNKPKEKMVMLAVNTNLYAMKDIP